MAILGMIVIIGCVQNKSTKENTFLNFINHVNLEKSYSIKIFGAIASSGGGISYNETTEINSTDLKEIINEIKNMKVVGSFVIGNKSCFYGAQDTFYFVCFADNRIVNYLGIDGPSFSRFNSVDYDFNISRSTIINSINDLEKCNVDSDCTLASSCDPDYRTAINEKYSDVWERVPSVDDQCITGKYANYEQKEYFNVSCVNNVCEVKIAKDKSNSWQAS